MFGVSSVALCIIAIFSGMIGEPTAANIIATVAVAFAIVQLCFEVANLRRALAGKP